jgi:hypothetical protein
MREILYIRCHYSICRHARYVFVSSYFLVGLHMRRNLSIHIFSMIGVHQLQRGDRGIGPFINLLFVKCRLHVCHDQSFAQCKFTPSWWLILAVYTDGPLAHL